MQADVDQQLSVAVDWAPAYELVLSVGCFVTFAKHRLLELGEAWVTHVRERLPAGMAARLSRQSAALSLKHKEDQLLLLLVRACPVSREVNPFLDWLASLSAGDAYEVLAPYLPDAGPRLPRDFLSWRDRVVNVLHVWDDTYFSTVDPAILKGLAENAVELRQRLDASPQALIEEMTNGILVEAGEAPLNVTLIPQYHERPYNTDVPEQGGVIILYPADICLPTDDQPPSRLLRLTHALSDESRLRILRFVADGPRTLTEVARFIGLSQPTVHHHLVQLRAAGLVRVHFVANAPSRYSLRPHALDQLSDQLGRYLQPPVVTEERSQNP
ncbi:MAG: winged helix-turn-helix transcriptional regulator [Chloroflexi bacterium]|nr:winged helix-turn-helix transcriptional regulator [Chloroflexota bacterium]